MIVQIMRGTKELKMSNYKDKRFEMGLTPQFIRENYEKKGLWGAAAEAWKILGYDQDWLACNMIVQSKRQGDEFRIKMIEYCGPEPEVPNKQDNISWNRWYKKFQEFNLT